MGKSNSEKRRTHKYVQKSPATKNFVQHARWQFHRLLEQLARDPSLTNHLDRISDGEPVLRDALQKAGIAGLTEDELLEKRNDYVAGLEAGEKPYSSKLYKVGYLNDDGEMIDSQTGEVIPFVPLGSAN